MREFIEKRLPFLIYLGGGVLCALTDIGIMQLLIKMGAPYQIGTSAGFAASLLINYVFHAKLTFRANATAISFGRYMCVVTLNYFLTMAFVAAAVALIDSPVQSSALIGKIISLPIIAINGFVLGKYWIFKAPGV